MEAPGTDPILLQLRVLIDKQKGVDNHMYGITTTAWREFLEDSLDIPPSIALKFQANLHRCTQHAIDKMWKERNFARHGKTSQSEIWEHRVFEAAIRSWKNEAKRKGRDLLEGADERIRALPRKQKLAWVHNRLRGQKGIKEFWSSAPARSDVDAEIGRELELVEIELGSNVGQIPPDLPNRAQIRREREKDWKQSSLDQYFSGGSKVTTPKVTEATTVPASGLGTSRSNSKKRTASGDLRQKASKTQIVPSKDLHEDANRSNQVEGTEAGRLILEDQVQIEEENQGDDRPRAVAALSQLTLTSGISEKTRAMIVRKQEEAIQKKQAIKKKKDREADQQVEHETHKKQKSQQSENLKKRNIEDVEEEEESSPSRRQKVNGKKRDIMEVEDAEQENSSKREKSAGQNGCKQLGCSTHKGIS